MLDSELAQSLAHKLFRADQVRDNEKAAAEQSGNDMFTLMERAGKAVFEHGRNHFPNTERYLILVGHGNNAGDGYIAAVEAKRAGKQVAVCAVEPDRALSGDSQRAQQLWFDAGGQVDAFSTEALSRSDVVIDALLGTGTNSSIRPEYATIIDAVNASDRPVISIDVPSGLEANTGQSMGRCIQADLTVTFVGIKAGLSTGAGKQSCGRLVFEDLGIGKAFMALARASATVIELEHFAQMAPREVNSHKGTYGRLLCIGGNKGTAGAIRLSSEAALRSGAGLVKVYAHEDSKIQINAGRPELMVVTDNLDAALEWATCVVIGPGLGQDDWSHNAFEKTLNYCQSHKKPMVIDADALNILSRHSGAFNVDQCVITPHSGEAARLLSDNVEAVEADRFNAARLLAQRYHAICVLKGAGTIVDTEKYAWVCKHGNPGMATAGMGDVLSGVLGALLAQGLRADVATKYGVTVHARAGDILAQDYGQRGLLASDLFDTLRALINHRLT
ncbi:NAD(P)H-hydrate dehydratase [Alteromonas oceanisediminis]|uniref:NAD(P)H-hydrate dehydratase n=1 Tax=Alteromonas oceanisediminis TaxID=2836180 RepID=UPI001BDB01A5|nr:NAD(P)H-hydrate dehydratase [Alteromonas oceanisediminis]MBT0586930.1 NAD(P)H-hydrate dehydratase [Alteromonas oceanisediminis]